jgi:hypothetical protein
MKDLSAWLRQQQRQEAAWKTSSNYSKSSIHICFYRSTKSSHNSRLLMLQAQVLYHILLNFSVRSE